MLCQNIGHMGTKRDVVSKEKGLRLVEDANCYLIIIMHCNYFFFGRVTVVFWNIDFTFS